MQVRHLSQIVFIANIAAPGVIAPSGTVHLSASENHTCPDSTYGVTHPSPGHFTRP